MPTTKKSPLDHLMSKKKAVRKSAWICLDNTYSEIVDELEQELKEAQFLEQTTMAPKRPSSAVQAALIEARANLIDNSQKFVFEGIGRKPYEKLVEAHAPSKEFLAKAVAKGIDRAAVMWDGDTFPNALMEASLISPALQPGELTTLLASDAWGDAEFTKLFIAAYSANTEIPDINLGNV